MFKKIKKENIDNSSIINNKIWDKNKFDENEKILNEVKIIDNDLRLKINVKIVFEFGEKINKIKFKII